MSKTIDVLNKHIQAKNKIHDSIQEEIAKIYLKTSNKKSRRKKNTPTSKAPWLVALSASLLIPLLLILKSNVDIKIRVLSKIPSIEKEGAQGGHQFSKGIIFVKGGEPNNGVIKNTLFLGDARDYSKMINDKLTLCNSKGHGWANYTIELKEPIDLTEFDIKYTAKGERGDEHLVLILVDAENRAYRMEKGLSSALTKDWEMYTMDFRSIRNAINLKDISIIRFEFGSLTAGNYPTSTIFLKDVYVTKTRRLKWL